MKRAKKIFSIILPVLAIAVFMFATIAPCVLADGPSVEWPTGGDEITAVTNLAGSVWTTILTVAQILAFAAVVFAGVRYMFASADQKADIKKGLIYLVIGAILVFAASTVVKIIAGAANKFDETGKPQAAIVSIVENV